MAFTVVVLVAVSIIMVMVVIVVMVFMVMAVTLLAVVVMVVVLVSMVMVVTVTIIIVVMVVVMVVTVTFDVLVEFVIESGIIDRVVHPVPEFPFVHVEDGAHEGEVDLLLGLEGSVVLHSVLEVRQVQGDTGSVIKGDGCLDVSEKTSGLLLHPLPDGQEGLGEPGLGVGVEAVDLTGESDCASSGLLDRCLLMIVVLMVVIVVVLAHCIIS